ncbi:UrcA family protein [Sandarakinorhabdus sp.]|uniref:UrcA family protein n=1 Tax=Sandarakinorhabdus sp. TaxID=1916663 RepID=UPI003F72D35C
MRILMAAAMAAMVAAPAVAAERGYETFSVTFQTADLDLASAEGQQQFDRRLSNALGRLCGTPVFGTREELADLDACRAEATQAAAPQIKAARARLATAIATR